MNIKSHNLILMLFMILNANFLFAQTHTVSGFIYEGDTRSGIPGVTIVEKNTTNGITTDVNGKYSLKVSSPNAVLVVSFIGYHTQEINIGGRSTVDVNLQVEITDLSEIVVIGYGSQKKKVVTGAIAQVKDEDIAKMPLLRVDQALQGRTAGVQVMNQSGQPGEAPTIRVRGVGTTGNSDPLYVIDGFVRGGLDQLNPGDIESIEVLKDAASAAIYGSSAANGVVIITTKSGKAGKMNISYSGYRGFQNTANRLDMLNADEYRMMMNEGARNAGLTEPFDLNEIAKYDTDWQDLLFVKNAPMQNHELQVSGGNDKSTYLSSVSYFSQQGIIGGEKSQFDRLTARLNTTHQVNPILRFQNNISYGHVTRRGIASNASFNGAFSSALNLDPLTPLHETDPEILAQAPYSTEPVVKDEFGRVYGISNWVGGEVVNPLALLETQNSEYRLDNVYGTLMAELEPIKGLKFTSTFGGEVSYGIDDSWSPLFYLNGAQGNLTSTSVNKTMERWLGWQWDNTVSYGTSIDNHNFNILVGSSAEKHLWENLSGSNRGVPIIDPDHVYLNMATDTLWTAYGGAAQNTKASLFGRLTYNFKEKYSLTGIVRRDGSSRFGANNRYGIFPSVGVSWVVSDESFFPEIDAINVVKLRASYGINGNDRIGDYRFISTINKSRGYIFGNGRIIGASPSYIENNDIAWEESEQTNFAIDLEALNNKLVASVDYYIKNTNGLLETVRIPAHVGNDAPVANVGSVQNKGVEININWRQLVKEFRYSIGVNATYNQNEMTYIGNDEKILPGASWAVSGMVTRAEEGLPIGYFWGYVTDGIFQNQNDVYRHDNAEGQYLQPSAKPGDVRFVDINGDGKIDPDDRTMIGNPYPDWTFGFDASAEYRGFDFSMLWIGSYGNEIFNGSQRQDLRYTNRTTAILDRWTEEGSSDRMPRYTWLDVNNNYRISDLYIEDGSFIRLKNIQIGYNLPVSLLQKVRASVFRIYISGENMLTFTKYTGADPEVGATSTFDVGIDRGIYPQARTIRIGTTITF